MQQEGLMMKKSLLSPGRTGLLLSLVAVACAPGAEEQEAQNPASSESTAEMAAQVTAPADPLRKAYFGETHVHGAFSLDAYIGGARLEPDDQYRFAKGEAVTLYGKPHSIGRPLDFVALSDHAEYLGEMYSAMVPSAPGHEQPELEQLRGLSSLEERRAWFAKYVVENNRGDNPQHPPFFHGFDTTKSAWKLMVEAADRHNEPGQFTALIGFEWSAAPGGGNLHRNVIFRDAHVPDMPVSSYEIRREDQLWEWMEQLEGQGMDLLAIPHNSNSSKTMMFPEVDAEGEPIDLEYAERRQHFEPLIEMMQIKGNSEVHRNFWTADEFADFENADSLAEFSGRTLDQRNFVRWGLEKGLAYQQELGGNPFKYGFIGGTDNHNGASADVVESNWPGSHGPEDGSVEARRTGEVGGWAQARDLNPGSLAAVWATENTRAAIFDAMKRRETFATSGPRIQVRFFGGFDLPGEPADPKAMVEQGYELGVPMGGDLPPTGAAPTFTVLAMKDPDGANLDRIQIIKGWVDAGGELQEKIVDVVWWGERTPGEDGKLPPVGSTVDLTTAEYTNTIGGGQLMGGWTDDEFDPAQHAFYYARVLEIPTPRWSTYDAVHAGLPLLEDVPATIQERAWASPIWYSP
jgi:hypothetical protein